MKNEIEQIIVNHIDRKISLGEATTQILRLFAVSGQSEQLCGFFEPGNKTSSATKCKCGREKWEHPKAT